MFARACHRPISGTTFYSKTNWMHQILKFILFWNNIYMFRTVFPSIIKSSRPYIQQQVYVKQIMLPAYFNSKWMINRKLIASSTLTQTNAESFLEHRSFQCSWQDCIVLLNKIKCKGDIYDILMRKSCKKSWTYFTTKISESILSSGATVYITMTDFRKTLIRLNSTDFYMCCTLYNKIYVE